jgi:hypothetical protein
MCGGVDDGYSEASLLDSNHDSNTNKLLCLRTRMAAVALERLSWSLQDAGRPLLAEMVIGCRKSILGAEIISRKTGGLKSKNHEDATKRAR